jgi:nucleotide-binding universal stress UspA family protein
MECVRQAAQTVLAGFITRPWRRKLFATVLKQGVEQMAMQSPNTAPANLRVRRPMVAPVAHLANPTRVDFYAPSERQSTDAQATPSAIRTVVVPLDGSSFGEHAIPRALRIAKLAGAEVRLVHVHVSLDPSYLGRNRELYGGFEKLLKQPKQEYMADVMKRVAKISSVPVTPLLLDGRKISESLCNAVNAEADLVVMATRGRGALGRLVWGSFADTLLQETGVPLLLVRGYRSPVDLTGAPSLRRILVPLDGSLGGEDVLRPVAEIGRITQGEQTLLRVLPFTGYSPMQHNHFSLANHAAQQQDEALDECEQLVNKARVQLPRAQTKVVWSAEPPGEEILAYAERHDVDLIAVATRKRSPLKRLLSTGVADYLIRRAGVPVLVVKQDSEGWRHAATPSRGSLEDTIEFCKS